MADRLAETGRRLSISSSIPTFSQQDKEKAFRQGSVQQEKLNSAPQAIWVARHMKHEEVGTAKRRRVGALCLNIDSQHSGSWLKIWKEEQKQWNLLMASFNHHKTLEEGMTQVNETALQQHSSNKNKEEDSKVVSKVPFRKLVKQTFRSDKIDSKKCKVQKVTIWSQNMRGALPMQGKANPIKIIRKKHQSMVLALNESVVEPRWLPNRKPRLTVFLYLARQQGVNICLLQEMKIISPEKIRKMAHQLEGWILVVALGPTFSHYV